MIFNRASVGALCFWHDIISIMLRVLIIVIGLSIGSFVNVLIARTPSGKKISGRSKCPECGVAIRWYDLVPILSFVVLYGRCRACGRRISWRYPLVELITVAVFGVLFLMAGGAFTFQLFFLWVISAGLIALAGCDLEKFILPDSLIAGLSAFVLVFKAVTSPSELISMCVTGFLLALGFGILFLVSRGSWLGLGDVKLAFLVGLILNYPLAIVVVLGAIWSAAIVGVILVAIRRASFKSALPFGTFLAGASVVAITFNNEIIKFSEHLFR